MYALVLTREAGTDRAPQLLLLLQYSVSPELVTSLLEPAFELQWQGVPPDQPEERKGIEQVMLWKRK